MNNKELEKIIFERKEFVEKKLTARQHRLKDWLKENFVSGRYYTIEEVVKGVVDSEGKPYYTLNTNPYTHDKCVALGNDVKAINWNITQRYIPIIKDSKGSIKLAESKEEAQRYINKEKEKVQRKCEFLNTLASKIEQDGTIPFINQANRVLTDDELQPIDAFIR